MKIKNGSYFVAIDNNDIKFGGILLIVNGGLHLLSDYDELNHSNLSTKNRQGFKCAYRITGVNINIYKDYKDINIINDYINQRLSNDVLDFKIVTKIEALKAIISYRKNNINIITHNTIFNGKNFIFGCGSMEASPKDIQIILKLLSKYKKEEWLELMKIIFRINENDYSALEHLKDEEQNIKKLLKMPTYLNYLKEKKYLYNLL